MNNILLTKDIDYETQFIVLRNLFNYNEIN